MSEPQHTSSNSNPPSPAQPLTVILTISKDAEGRFVVKAVPADHNERKPFLMVGVDCLVPAIAEFLNILSSQYPDRPVKFEIRVQIDATRSDGSPPTKQAKKSAPWLHVLGKSFPGWWTRRLLNSLIANWLHKNGPLSPIPRNGPSQRPGM